MTLKGILEILKHCLIGYLLFAYLMPLAGGIVVLNYMMDIAKRLDISGGWAVFLYYLPLCITLYVITREDKKDLKGVSIDKRKTKKAHTTRRRKGENDADYLARIIEKNCPTMTEQEIIAWIKEHKKRKPKDYYNN